jgi:hypothetical protein
LKGHSYHPLDIRASKNQTLIKTYRAKNVGVLSIKSITSLKIADKNNTTTQHYTCAKKLAI